MSGRLHVARGLELDPDYVGAGTFALLAKKGAGKSYASRVLAEELWDAHVPFVLFDPMGVCWGLRSSADGKGDGIPIAIFGGTHGDAPLERGSGALMADLVIDEGLSMILDYSAFGSHAAEREFAHAFLERLYRRNTDLVHLLIDEADLFAPQKPQRGDEQLLGVMDNVVRRGRNRGIGVTLMTQRPAVLNKDVLTQIDGLVAMRVVGLPDREAVDHWIKGHGEDPTAAAEVKGTLAGLANGESWWWIPELGILKRVQIRRSRTFDSSPSRKRGERRRPPKGFADVDLGAIEQRMASTIERAKAEDPKELRKQIAQLRRELAQRPTETVKETVTETVEVPVLEDAHVERLEDAVELLSGAAAKIITAANDVSGGLGKLKTRTPAPPVRQPTPAPAPKRQAAPSTPPPAADGDFQVSTSQQRILNALAALEVIGVTMANKTQLALFAEASPKSSGYTNNLGALRTAGLIDYPQPGTVAMTPAGRGYADASAAPSTAEELQAYVRQLVGGSRARLLDQLIAAYPDAIAKDELADLAGVSAKSSGYTNNLGSLRSLGLIDYPSPGYVAALPVLFLEAA